MEYCLEPYTRESYGDNAFLNCNQPQDEDIQLILPEEVEIAVEAPKTEKPSGVENIPAELIIYQQNCSSWWISHDQCFNRKL